MYCIRVCITHLPSAIIKLNGTIDWFRANSLEKSVLPPHQTISQVHGKPHAAHAAGPAAAAHVRFADARAAVPLRPPTATLEPPGYLEVWGRSAPRIGILSCDPKLGPVGSPKLVQQFATCSFEVKRMGSDGCGVILQVSDLGGVLSQGDITSLQCVKIVKQRLCSIAFWDVFVLATFL